MPIGARNAFFSEGKRPQSAISSGRPGRAAAVPGAPGGRCGRGAAAAPAVSAAGLRSGGARGTAEERRQPAAEPSSRSRGEPGAPQRERARDRKEGAGQPGRERPREARRQPGRSHFLPQVPFQVQLPLEDLGAILRLIRLLLQALDLPLHRFQGARRGHGRGAGGGQGAEVLHVAARGPAPFNGPMTSRGWRWRWGW